MWHGVARMLFLSRQVNTLKERLETYYLGTRKYTVWSKKPQLWISQGFQRNIFENSHAALINWNYLKSYIREHFDGNNDIVIHQEIHIFLLKRNSNFKLGTQLLWISYTEIDIVSWYSRCKTGAMVVGVFVHISAVLWYLRIRYVRYIYNIDEDRIGVRDWASFVEDNASFLEKIDNSKSDESTIEE